MTRLRKLAPEVAACYRDALGALGDVPFLVGGAFALEHYAGIVRDTKDMDVFVRQADAAPALERLARIGCATELRFPHWLGKAARDGAEIDVIFGFGNGVGQVDEGWFLHATRGNLLEQQVSFCPVEETLWSKAFVMERERFDGADVAHLLRAQASRLDWPRLLRRFAGHEPVLFAHLVLFGYVYPGLAQRVPAEVLRELSDRLEAARAEPPPDSSLCRGPLLSRAQYVVDVDGWGLRDVRLGPATNMTPQDVARWTAGIAKDGDPSLHDG